jgi:AcrR family transcriptional regulator
VPTALAKASTRSRRALRKGERTAERILDAAESLFAAQGYAGTTLRDVAGAVGVRIPSLYNHFPSKEALYAAVLERGIGPVLSALQEYVESRVRGRPDTARLLERVMEVLAHRPDLARLVQHETLTGGERLSPLLREWFRPIFSRARESIDAHPGAERWDPEQIPLLVLALYHVVVGHFTIAPVWRDLEGDDLLSAEGLAQQTRFLGALVATLLPENPSRTPTQE